MAYTHGLNEYTLLTSEGVTHRTLTLSGRQWSHTPGYQPYIVRAVGIVITASGAAAGARRVKMSAFRNSTPGGTATTTLTLIDTATLGSLLARGKVVYMDNLNTQINPGQELVVRVTQAATQAAKAKVIATVEQHWEHPDNNTNLVDRT